MPPPHGAGLCNEAGTKQGTRPNAAKEEGPERCGVHHSSPCAQGEYLLLLLLALHNRRSAGNMPMTGSFRVLMCRDGLLSGRGTRLPSPACSSEKARGGARAAAANCILTKGEIQTGGLAQEGCKNATRAEHGFPFVDGGAGSDSPACRRVTAGGAG